MFKHDICYNCHLVFLSAVAPKVLCLLWRMANHCIVTIMCLTYSLCSLRQESWRESDFNEHSLRIGAATSASAAGVPETTIKVLGHWQYGLPTVCQIVGGHFGGSCPPSSGTHAVTNTHCMCISSLALAALDHACMQALSLCSPCLVVWAVVPVSEFTVS